MHKVFIEKLDKPRNSYEIGAILGKSKTKGDVGLEIEVEGRNFPKENTYLAPFWTFHPDNSLRGEDNAEYVLTKPILFEHVEEALKSLWGKFAEKKSRLDRSNRTSVHVHLNCQQFHLTRLASFAALYFCFEEILTEWCGDHRVGNLFCLRAKDAPAIVTSLKKFLKNDGDWEFTDGYHYSGFNVHALRKFGSVEIRTMRGDPDMQKVLDWVMILRRLYEMSGDFDDPRDVIGEFSGNGAKAYFERCLGSYAPMIQKDIGWTSDQIENSVYQGVRMAQDIAYCRDWSRLRNIDLKEDPFGRNSRYVMKKLSSQSAAASSAVVGSTQWVQEQLAAMEAQHALDAQIYDNPFNEEIPPSPVWGTLDPFPAANTDIQHPDMSDWSEDEQNEYWAAFAAQNPYI